MLNTPTAFRQAINSSAAVLRYQRSPVIMQYAGDSKLWQVKANLSMPSCPLACRNATAKALADPSAAWAAWLVKYNITYASRAEADFRRRVWGSSLERANQLNLLMGPEVAVSMALLGVGGCACNSRDLALRDSCGVVDIA